MRWMRRTAAAAMVALAAAAIAGCAADSGTVTRSDGDSGKAVQLTVGQKLVVDLEENATTGYSWQLEAALPSMLATAGDETRPAGQAGVVGAAGRRVLTYAATRAGNGELRLVYARPWEHGVPPAKTFTVPVTVR